MIDTEALRKKVIDLAIQGKLTEQLPSDGDAETLYAQILDQKLQLIKEGKIKKDKELPDIAADEIPFEVPDNWKWVRLGNLCLQITDGTHRTPTYQNDGIPFLSVKNISSGVFDLTDIKYISEEEHSELIKRCKPEKNDVLVCRIGTLGKAITIDIDLEFSIFVSLGLIKTTEKIISDYIVQVINSGYGDTWIKDNKAGGAMHTYKINLNSLALLPVPLAPISEIERILQLKDEVKTHIENIYNLQAKYSNDLAVLKSKIIDAGIRGKLTKQLPEDGDAEDLYAQILNQKSQLIKERKIKKEKSLPNIAADEIPFEIPKNWKWIRLGDVASIYGGKRIPAGRSLTTEDTGHKYIRVSDMKNGTVITDNLLFVPEDIYSSISRYIINKEDVYITVAGTIGKVGKIPAEIDGVNLTENADRIVFEGLSQNWLIRCLSAAVVQKQIESLTTQVAQPKLAIKRIQEFIIPLPPYAEQDRIATKIDAVLEQLN